jgi:Flp pilus assembly pilin Flp
MVEYSLLVALLAVATIGGLTLLQDGASASAQSSADKISTHTIPTTTLP